MRFFTPAAAIWCSPIARSPTQGSGLCSGSLISPHVVMTAGHCVPPSDSGDWTYEIGFADAYDASIHQFIAPLDSVKRMATKAFRHPGYKLDLQHASIHNDLALLLIDNGPPAGVKPIPYDRYRITSKLIGQTIRMVGFGNHLRTMGFTKFTKLTATNQVDVVMNEWLTVDDSEQITCEGDSGGPALWTVDGREVV